MPSKAVQARLNAIEKRHLDYYDKFPQSMPKRIPAPERKRYTCIPDRRGRWDNEGRGMWDTDMAYPVAKRRQSF
jgi:hypothetical protein